MNSPVSGILTFSICIAALLLSACYQRSGKPALQNQEVINHSSAYDDSTLKRNTLPVMMPYNRIIEPAGTTLRYGDPDLENHSLDIKLLPGMVLAAVEDRYGIAILNTQQQKIDARWSYGDDKRYRSLMSTYSGIETAVIDGKSNIFWSAASPSSHQSLVFRAIYDKGAISVIDSYSFAAEGDSPLALPNEVAFHREGNRNYLYVVINGNNQLVKIDVQSGEKVWTVPTGVCPYGITLVNQTAYVTNWAGDLPGAKVGEETAGIPYGRASVAARTGAVSTGTVSVFNLADGRLLHRIPVGLHPNDIIHSADNNHVFVANSNSDNISVISTRTAKVVSTISVQIDNNKAGFIGDSPNALALDESGNRLLVANGLDNAVAVIQLHPTAGGMGGELAGFIPTEAYPGGLAMAGKQLLVTNLEGEGARVNSHEMTNADAVTGNSPAGAYNSHHQKATLSIIPMPENPAALVAYTQRVKSLMLHFRTDIARLAPRPGQPERPMPERIGEPSVFKHVVYIIKENRTYDQVLGDLPKGNGMPGLCIFGDAVTPNQHRLAQDYVLLDNYYASGKCSAEGHQWTDAAMVTDYVEKNVRAWFRSYPHVQNDAMVYSRKGFIWNNAADHGKKVKIYGEACEPEIDTKLSWTDIYSNYKAGKPLAFKNTTTISRVQPMLAADFPGSDYLKITDQIRADAFINDLHRFEHYTGDTYPDLCIVALATDHTTGTRPGMPTPSAMVADNDLAVGRIIAALSKSRFWKNTVVFITEDDSQAGWDHISAYRTTGFVISPYSRMQQTVSANYNQTSMVRSIEQILGIPPMNLMDATALPMFSCFNNRPVNTAYVAIPNRVPLNEMNPALGKLKGKALLYARQSMWPEYDHIDGGNDDVLNRIIWYSQKKSKPYPSHLAGKVTRDDDDD